MASCITEDGACGSFDVIAGPRGGKAGSGGFLYHLRGFFYNIEFGIGLAGRKPASSERVSLHVPWGPTEGAIDDQT